MQVAVKCKALYILSKDKYIVPFVEGQVFCSFFGNWKQFTTSTYTVNHKCLATSVAKNVSKVKWV